ncbi:MAG TPA: S1 RNA-binding domain-containing protein [Candidatus Acidoferrum sp.]|nr:S1 RNA-binding domain-containing protein [Candidatus Acidoferrum sp.]
MNDSDLSETNAPAEAASLSESAAPVSVGLDVIETPAPVVASPESETAPSEPVAAEASTPEPSAAPEPPVDERRARAQRAWERVVAARESGEVLSGIVTAAVKGGLLVDVGGVRGFLPASQVRIAQGGAIEALVKTRVPLKVIDVDQARRRIVVSHRRAAEDERRAKRAQLIRELEVGQTREVVVVRLADFGAFVDLGGIDGLIPMGELAFERVEKASDVVKIGDRLSVQVIRVEDNGKKIALSRKNALPDPWRDHADLLRQGTVVEGKVVAKEPRLQVELAPGVVGTLRESDADPADYEIGEAIEVSVRSVDRRMRRIVLTTLHGTSAATTTTSSGFASLGVELGRRF